MSDYELCLETLKALIGQKQNGYDDDMTFKTAKAISKMPPTAIHRALQIAHANGMKEAADRMAGKAANIQESADWLGWSLTVDLFSRDTR